MPVTTLHDPSYHDVQRAYRSLCGKPLSFARVSLIFDAIEATNSPDGSITIGDVVISWSEPDDTWQTPVTLSLDSGPDPGPWSFGYLG
jgi:hypothetical protein